MSLSPGEPIGGRYQLGPRIGAGGMGTVHEARDVHLQRRVAIKLLPEGVRGDPIARERLRGEALAAAALDHPFICKIHELGDDNGLLFVVMEYVEGETLQAFAARGLPPVARVVEIAIETAEALDEAHRRGLVHRDLKPANLMITAQGHVKVMDFGLAKPVRAPASADSEARTVLTGSQTRLGTPAYMSPEQILGGALDPRSDVFSLGVVLYELATGVHPFKRDDASATWRAILSDPPAGGARDLEESPGLAALVRRMLAKACAERPQSMAELRSGLEALRDATRGLPSGAAALPVEPSTERTPFVGREAETGVLQRMLDAMLTGKGGLVLVGGEPGVGKTRLARELQRAARQRGCLSLTGHCYEMEGAPPFAPFVEITEDAARLVPRAVRAAMGEQAPEIASIVPGLRRLYDDIPPMPALPAEQQRHVVFSALLDYLRRGAEKSPAVLLLDDLHWADDATLQFLAHLAPHLSSMRLLIVGTYRDVELVAGRPFARTLETLLRQRLAERVALRRLDEHDVAGMLTSMSGAPPPSGLAHAIFSETEGNPFFVEEVYQHLEEEGKLFDEGGRWKADLRVGAIEVPESVRLVVGRRLDRLGDQARKVLAAGAVIGRTFPLDVVIAAAGVPDDDVLDALEQAERAQLVAVDASRRALRYSFVHELIRTTLVESLSLPRRQRMHLRIADAIEASSTAADRHPARLAHHLYQAGAAADAQRTAAALGAAARAADEAGAFEDLLETVDNLLSLDLPDGDPAIGESWERRGRALAGLERTDDAVAALDRAAQLYAARSEDAGVARCARELADRLYWLGRYDQALPVLERALGALTPAGRAERALVGASIGTALVGLSRLDEGSARVDEAVAIAETVNETRVLAAVLTSRGAVERAAGELAASNATARRALTLLGDDPYARADLLANLAIGVSYLGRLDQIHELVADAVPAARRSGHHMTLWLRRWFDAIDHVCHDGDVAAFLQRAEALRASRHFPYINGLYVGAARLYAGNEDGAFEALAGAVAAEPDTYYLKGLPESSLLAAAALVGRDAQARSLLPAVEPRVPVPGRRNLSGTYFVVAALAEGLAWLEECERLARLYPAARVAVDAGFRHMPFVIGPINASLAAALAADANGLTEQADEHFAAAGADARDIPIRLLQPMVRYWQGRSVTRRPGTGERERGLAMIRAALDDFRGLGMVPHARQAERLLANG